MDSYQMVFASGVAPAAAANLGDAVAELPTLTADEDTIQAAFATAGVSPSDTRARMVAALGGSPIDALIAYAAIVGFSGRMVDAAVDGEVFRAEMLATQIAGQLKKMQRPTDKTDLVVASAIEGDIPALAYSQESDGEEPQSVVTLKVDPAAPLQGLTGAQLQQLRFSRRATVVLPEDTAAALSLLGVLTATRLRGNVRFPVVVVGEDLVDLEKVRQIAGELRRTIRPYTLALAPAEEPTDRQVRLNEADAIPVETAMGTLGAVFNSDAEAWHCPRPERHSNGDATPSMRVTDGRVRCYRCDAEWVGSLRLVADTLDVSDDEAADTLLDPPSWADELLAARRETYPTLAG